MKILFLFSATIFFVSCSKSNIVYEATHEKCEGIVLRKEYPIPEYGYNNSHSRKYGFTSYVKIPMYELTDLYTHYDKVLCDSVNTDTKVWVYATVFHKIIYGRNFITARLIGVKVDSLEITKHFRTYSDTGVWDPKKKYFVAKSLRSSDNKR